MSEKAYQQCTRCVMDTTDPETFFNEKGECNHCTEFLDKRIKHQYRGKESDIEFTRIIAEIKSSGKGKEYDCVMGLSGGVDSSYVAWLLRQNGVRVLAIHLDNGWNSEEAVSNIKNIADKLGVDYESYVLDWEEFREIQLAFLKASVPEAETPTDIAIPAALHKIAAKFGVKYIISGGNFATEGILPKAWHYDAKDLTYFNYIVKNFGTRKVATFPTFGFVKEAYYKVVKGIKMIYLLNYVDFQKEKAMELLKAELGWKYYGGKHYESKYTGYIQSYYLCKKFNIDYRKATFSSLICNGTISRASALEQLQESPYKLEVVREESEYIAKKLGITQKELEDIVNLPPKYYYDYPNSEKKLKLIYDTYRRLFKKEKLGSF